MHRNNNARKANATKTKENVVQSVIFQPEFVQFSIGEQIVYSKESLPFHFFWEYRFVSK